MKTKKPSVDIESEILKYYSNKRSKTAQKAQTSKTHSLMNTSQRIVVPPVDEALRMEEFLKCERIIAPESEPLEMRELPRGLKLYFPKGPNPPPVLEPIPYTHEVIPDQPVKLPKRKPGEIAEWVIEQMGWHKEQQQVIVKKKEKYKFSERGLELAKKFQISVNEIVKQVRAYKIDIHAMFERKVKLSKAYQYHNSKEFFVLIKQGSKDAQTMLAHNPMLAYDHDEQNLTALHWAAREGFQNLVKVLIQRFHSHYDAKDIYGRTPLYLAVINQKTQCIYRLVISGAKMNVMDYRRQFIKDVAPNIYIKYILEKLEEIRFMVNTKGPIKPEQYRKEIEKQIRATLDPASFYF